MIYVVKSLFLLLMHLLTGKSGQEKYTCWGTTHNLKLLLFINCSYIFSQLCAISYLNFKKFQDLAWHFFGYGPGCNLNSVNQSSVSRSILAFGRKFCHFWGSFYQILRENYCIYININEILVHSRSECFEAAHAIAILTYKYCYSYKQNCILQMTE